MLPLPSRGYSLTVERVFSGIQPTGDIHVGNYAGAIKQWVDLLDDFECFFCIVDYHALTVEFDPRDMSERIYNTVVVNIACGLDPARCTIFLQSHVPAHTELTWFLNTVTPMGELGRMTQFKEKSEHQKQNVNAGLFDYPVLMAADILLYKASVVPVGEDQLQHVELCRDVARRFNARYGEVFPEPRAKVGPAPRILGLDGKAKMSKSLGNTLGVLEDPESIRTKLSTAFTDPQRLRRKDPGRPEICNIFTLHSVFSTPEERAAIDHDCRTAGIGCFECKAKLADNLEKTLGPIRTAAQDLLPRRDYIRDVLAQGATRCRAIARETIDEVKTRMGLTQGVLGEAERRIR